MHADVSVRRCSCASWGLKIVVCMSACTCAGSGQAATEAAVAQARVALPLPRVQAAGALAEAESASSNGDSGQPDTPQTAANRRRRRAQGPQRAWAVRCTPPSSPIACADSIGFVGEEADLKLGQDGRLQEHGATGGSGFFPYEAIFEHAHKPH